MKNIKCGFVISFNGPYYSNFVASIFSLEKNMQTAGIETVYVFPSESKDFDWMKKLLELTLNVHFIDFNPWSIDNFKKIKALFKKEKVNLIYSRMSGWDFVARFAFPTLPVVWHMDYNVNVVDWKSRILNWVKFKILGFGKTYHIAASNSVADAINSLKPKHTCEPILNSIDFDRLNLKNAHTINEPHKLLVFGWHPQVKGLDTTLDALEIVNKDAIKYELIISAQKLTYEYMDERYGDNVPSWVTIFPPTDDVSSLYDDADIMISASRSESFSFCLAEALYSGLPVVFSDIAGTSWAKEFKNAYEFKVENVDNLIRCLGEVQTEITDEQLAFNRNIIKKKYSMDSWSKKIISYLETIK